MTPNISAAFFNFFAVVFVMVALLGTAIGVYAAVSLKKLEKQAQQ